MWNSVRITAISVSGLMLFCIPAAYAFAKMRFWGRNTLFALMLATLMIPDIVTLIPNFLTVVWFSRLSSSVFRSRRGLVEQLAIADDSVHGLCLHHLHAAPVLQPDSR